MKLGHNVRNGLRGRGEGSQTVIVINAEEHTEKAESR